MSKSPAIIDSPAEKIQNIAVLEPVSLEKPPYNEDWLQNLIHTRPDLVPAGDIEASFDKIIPVVREFPVPSGFLDNLFVTPEGYPVLVEVKLWKNQEARRKVVAQILEYAKDFASLTYEDINQVIRKQNRDQKWGNDPLYEILSENVASPPEEALFVDRVTRNLREGRFLLLVLGDGIREEMASLADYLMHHSLRYAFGMVEIKLFTLPDGALLAIPQVLAKTQTIERHVTVVTAGDGVTVSAPVIQETVEKTSLSTDEFYRLMSEKNQGAVSWFKRLLEGLSDLPVELETGTSDTLMIKAPVPDGKLTLMLLTPDTAQFWGVPYKKWKDPAWRRLASLYLEKISRLVPEAEIKEYKNWSDIKLGSKPLPVDRLFGKEKELAEAMREVLKRADDWYEEGGSGL